jgi:hypothetical protein
MVPLTDSESRPVAPPDRPPRPLTDAGTERRIGVELELAGLDCDAAAAVVQRVLGGHVRRRDSFRLEVEKTSLGEFVVELDTRYAHAGKGDGDPSSLQLRLKDGLAEVVGTVAGLWLPVEVVCPPVVPRELGRIDELREALRRAGAVGTHDSVIYAFGLQLNLEVATTEAGYILAHLRAYLLLSDWLREDIGIDLTRRVAPFVRPFPPDYARLVLQEGYRPGRGRLIDDYLAFNPTRNRELDMMPLFAALDPGRVRAAVDDELIKPRPTFHYRLPDSRIEDPAWRIRDEWRRWLHVERLADDPERLAAMSHAFLERHPRPHEAAWVKRVREWLGV